MSLLLWPVSAPEVIVAHLAADIGLKVCDLPFAAVARQASEETWTRDPFDRIIVAQARVANATLITRDETIQARYNRALG
ncbi:MAG: PIN domain-containing protein [Acidobacteriota bacterium]